MPRPLLPREKGSKTMIFMLLAPLPWERGWGEVELTERELSISSREIS